MTDPPSGSAEAEPPAPTDPPPPPEIKYRVSHDPAVRRVLEERLMEFMTSTLREISVR
ncbi:MAG TPA: hypothetical protein VK858_10630 [Longimicrobiales bacterium]|nr:hypothetical protein [Longimicrobiales bacterium]